MRIATGFIDPHFLTAGSGGRTVIAPGVAHHEISRTIHCARFMEDPIAIQCYMSGCPLYEEQLEIVERQAQIHALNMVVDEERDLAHVNLGGILESGVVVGLDASNLARVEGKTAEPAEQIASLRSAAPATCSVRFEPDRTGRTVAP